MTTRWNESVTLEFVKLYLKHECLWNPQHQFYSIKSHRDKALSAIIKEFRDATSKNLSIPEVRNKIKNLRTTYTQEVHKILTKSSPDLIYEPTLIWFHVMDERLKHVAGVKRQSASDTMNLESDEVNTSEVDSSCLIWFSPDPQGNSEYPDPDPLVPEDIDFNSEHNYNVKYERNPSPHKKIKNKKLKRRSSEHMSDSTSNLESREDEFDIYGKYIAEQLRRMDLQKALRLQLEIQSLVSNARIADM